MSRMNGKKTHTHTDSFIRSVFSENRKYPSRWDEPVAWNLKFRFWDASIREGSSSYGLKFEHVMLVAMFLKQPTLVALSLGYSK